MLLYSISSTRSPFFEKFQTRFVKDCGIDFRVNDPADLVSDSALSENFVHPQLMKHGEEHFRFGKSCREGHGSLASTTVVGLVSPSCIRYRKG